MQTFVPEGRHLAKGFRALDSKRLGKQRVEAWQILNILRDVDNEGNPKKPGGWANHPAVQMWVGYETALAGYGILCCQEWIDRGYNDTMLERFEAVREAATRQIVWPPWLLNDEVARSHRSNLIRKFPEHYQPLWPDETGELEYVWPPRQNADRKRLTGKSPLDMMVISIEGETPHQRMKGHMMAKAKKAAPVVDDDDLEEIEDEVEVASSEGDAGAEFLTAKQAASKLGTDGRTLRKFLRKKHGTIGQGKRWAISEGEFELLKIEFAAWAKGSGTPKGEKAKAKKASPAEDIEPIEEFELEEDNDELEMIDDIDDLDDEIEELD